MAEVLVFSDIHVHSHKKSADRLQDCLDVLDWVFRTAVERRVKNILFLGDLFHDRSKIDILTLHKTHQVFSKYFGSPDSPNLWLLLGNHDMWSREKWDVYSPVVFSTFPNVRIIDKPQTIPIAGRNIDFLPYTANPIEALAAFGTGNHLLCSHLAIDGAILNSFGIQADVCVEHDNEMVKLDVGFLAGWKKVLLGHYHATQKLNDSVEYVGSPYQITFSETGQQKHIMLLDVDTLESEYIVNDFSRRHIITTPDKIESQPLDGNFVMVKVEDLGAVEVVELRKRIHKNHTVASLDIRVTPKLEADEEAMEDAKAVLESDDKMLERYMTEKGHGELDRELLLAIGTQITEAQCPN